MKPSRVSKTSGFLKKQTYYRNPNQPSAFLPCNKIKLLHTMLCLSGWRVRKILDGQAGRVSKTSGFLEKQTYYRNPNRQPFRSVTRQGCYPLMLCSVLRRNGKKLGGRQAKVSKNKSFWTNKLNIVNKSARPFRCGARQGSVLNNALLGGLRGTGKNAVDETGRHRNHKVF